jgi:hypothetical protein
MKALKKCFWLCGTLEEEGLIGLFGKRSIHTRKNDFQFLLKSGRENAMMRTV